MSIDKPTVLIADDEQHIIKLLKKVLSFLEYEVIAEATTGPETITLFEEKEPDILMLDINMPFKTGDEVLGELIEKYPEACIIMMTCMTDVETVQKCIELGAANYIRKDTPVHQIRELIKNTWNDHIERDS